MPQFDTILYLTFFINLIFYGFIFYFVMFLIVLPFFYNIFSKRFFKKQLNVFLSFLFKTYQNLIVVDLIKLSVPVQYNYYNLFYFTYFLRVAKVLFFNIKK